MKKLLTLLGFTMALVAGSAMVGDALSQSTDVRKAAIQSASIQAVATSATGATYVAATSARASKVVISNNTGVTLEIRRNGAGSTILIPTATVRELQVKANANELSLRRQDTGATSVSAELDVIAE